MSKLPRGPASTAPMSTPSGPIRSLNSGMTLPRSLASSLQTDMPTTPALTQRTLAGSRRATLTATTFVPLHADGSATISRSSGIAGAAGTRLLGIATSSTSASPSLPGEPHGASASNNAALRLGSSGELCCGEPVLIPTQGLRGTLRYLGPIDGKQGTWAGIELDEVGRGKNSGSVGGKAYFSCQPNTGLFLAPSKVQPILDKQRGPDVVQSADRRMLNNAQGGSNHPTLRPVQTPELSQRSQQKQAGRSRIGTETHQTTGMSHAASSRAITSPMLNRRKTLSRATPAMANVPIPEIPSGHPHSRLPPATISRGNSRTRPISTAGSIASNRTSSPSLSRPASRLMAPTSSTEPNMLALSPPRPASFQRTKPLGSTPATDQRQSRRNTGMHRPTATLSGRLAEQSNGRVSGAAPKSRTGAPADSVDRLRLRVDMLEAENRVLRLKNEQDKAHLAAGQMLARDLAIVNGSTSPQGKGVSLSPNSSDISMAEQHLKEAHDTLERECAAAKETIQGLESELRNLKAGSLKEAISPSTTSSNEDAKQNVAVETKDASVVFNSLSDYTDRESRISEMRAELKQMEEKYTESVLASEEAYSQLSQRIVDRDSMIRTLEAQLSNKVEETSALNARIGDASEELEKVTQLYRQLLGKGDVENSSEKSTNDGEVTSLNLSIERLQHELATSENAKMELIAELDDTKQMLSTARDQVDSAQCILDDTKMRLVDRDDMHAMVETYHGSMLQIARLLGGCPDEYGELVKQTLDGIPSKFDEAAVSQEVVGQLSSKVGECLSRLIKKADTSSSQIETMAGEAQVKDARISVLETEVSDLKRQLAQSPSETLAESDDHVSSSQLQYFQSRIEELESSNYQLEEKCDTLEEERILFNEYLKTLEAESNRLVDDIDLLTAQNQKLAEDLRVASMQNSTVSLDTIALDAKLGREPLSANSTGFDSSDPAAGSDAHPADASVEKDTTADLDSLRHKHEREVSTLQSRLADLELRKNNDIKKLQDEISTWENLVEDKIFKEAEFNDTISNLTNQIDRLQREIQRSCVPVVAASRDSNVQANDTRAASSNSLTASPHTNTNASDLRASSGDMKGATEPAVDSIDDEALFCDICESPGHGISDCPQMTTPANIFKQDVSIDSSRPYCDNCEAFQGHWTEDCPHGDEMF